MKEGNAISGDRVAGKVVVVTGAAGGQGAAMASALAAEGARVVAVDVQPPPAPPADGRYARLDVTDQTAWTGLATDLRDAYGRVDGFVSNAGITWRARLLEVQPAEVERVMRVNLLGTLLGMQALVPLMPPGSAIVTVGSVAALTGHYPVAYTASKWALRGLAKAASLELGPRGIRVNQVHPGYIETPMTAAASPAFREANIAATPLARTGEAIEVAHLAVYLMSDESSFVNGAEITVDGGMTAHGGVKPISDALR